MLFFWSFAALSLQAAGEAKNILTLLPLLQFTSPGPATMLTKHVQIAQIVAKETINITFDTHIHVKLAHLFIR